ncbi:transposase family protein [Acinetobacter sp. YH12021]|jgi:hypothetical protein|nr:transposase family protein [Acinetobacter sp. YH12021]
MISSWSTCHKILHISMFITSFGEQNITYRCCSNFRIHLCRPSKLSVEDQVLLCLSYWREYRTLFHVATSYGVSEPTASRIVRHVEDCLIKSNLFNLPKNLPEGEGIDWNVVIVDATEIPIQRPKKTEEKL